MFESAETNCLACQKSGISPCVKRWGSLKESKQRGNGNPGLDSGFALEETQGSAHEPSRQIPTAIGCLLSSKDRNMLEYVYTVYRRTDPDPWRHAMRHLCQRIVFNYGISIGKSPSVRFGLLAFSASSQFSRGIMGSEDQIDEYSIRGYQALRSKNCSEFDVEEMLTMSLLLDAEQLRYYHHVTTDRSNSSHLRAIARLLVHMRGMHSLLQHFGDRLRDATIRRFGKEV